MKEAAGWPDESGHVTKCYDVALRYEHVYWYTGTSIRTNENFQSSSWPQQCIAKHVSNDIDFLLS